MLQVAGRIAAFRARQKLIFWHVPMNKRSQNTEQMHRKEKSSAKCNRSGEEKKLKKKKKIGKLEKNSKKFKTDEGKLLKTFENFWKLLRRWKKWWKKFYRWKSEKFAYRCFTRSALVTGHLSDALIWSVKTWRKKAEEKELDVPFCRGRKRTWKAANVSSSFASIYHVIDHGHGYAADIGTFQIQEHSACTRVIEPVI